MSAAPLLGGVEIKERLEPLPEKLRQGQPYFDSAARLQSTEWYVIPSWFAGTWQTVQILQISAFNEQTAEEQELVKVLPRSEKETFGVQRDSKGALWTPATSYEFKFSDKDGASQKVWRLNSKIEESPGMVSLLTDDLLIELDENKKIKMTVRTQSKREFKLLDEKTLIAMCTVRSFDEGGLSLSTIKEVCVFRKIDRFKERNTFEEYDLRASFSKYLQNTGKGHLISPRTMETE